MRRLLVFHRGILFLLLITAGACQRASAQQSDCKCKIGSIGAYDFAVNIPRPAVDAQILRWRWLFWAARYFHHAIIESDKGCSGITIKDASALNAAQHGGKMLAGHEYTNTAPPSGPVNSLEYLFTGEITGTAEPYTLTVRLEAAYSREVVKSVSVPLFGTGDSAEAAGQALATQFLPLQEVIAAWERTKRQTDTEVARANPDGKMTIVPKKRALQEGEETELVINLTDCDGAPLPNREVEFLSGSWPKIGRLDGTSGGEVTPSTGTTDQNGLLKVRFKAGKAGIAKVNAWYGLFRPTGYPSAILGNTTIQIKPSKPDAPPTRRWTGDITFHFETHEDKQIDNTRNIDSFRNDFTFHLPPSGDPSVVVMSRMNTHEEHVSGVPCPQSAGEIMRRVEPKWKTITGTVDMERVLSGTYPADVVVKVDRGFIEIRASFGTQEADFKITKTRKTTGRCPNDGPPDDATDTQNYKQDWSPLGVSVSVAAQPSATNQQGTYKTPLGEVITWNLTRTALK